MTVEKDLIIPPRSEVIIPGNVSGACLENMEGMLEPSGALSSHYDELVARVVSKVEKGLIPVRLIIVAEHTHTLRRGMFVGTFCPDSHVEEELTVMVDTHEDQAGWSTDSLIKEFGLRNRGFNTADIQGIYGLLSTNLSVFSRDDNDLGTTHLTFYEIDTGQAPPIKMAPRQVPLHLQQEVTDHTKEMQKRGIIQPSVSPWAVMVDYAFALIIAS